MKIKLNNHIDIDLQKLIETRLLIQANSGGGKSWTLRRILEQSHGKVQHIIIDPEGEFSTLREKYDYILAGKDGDTPAEPRSAAVLARKLLELNVSAIIDLYELHPQERKHFVKLFLDALINSPKELHHPLIVVLDEAHTFAPEKGQSEALDAVIGLASLGRKREFCAILATQRISKLHKDVAAECNNKLIGRTGLDIDMKRAGEELGFTSKDQFMSLRSLDSGEFFAFGPAISKEVIKVKIGDVNTEPPKIGKKAGLSVPKPTEKIKSILKKLGDLPAEAKKEAQTISDFKIENQKLKQQLVTVERNKVTNLPVAMGVSQWQEYGRKNGYWQFFMKKFSDSREAEWYKEGNRINVEMKRLANTFSKIKEMMPVTLPLFATPESIKDVPFPIVPSSDQILNRVNKEVQKRPIYKDVMENDSEEIRIKAGARKMLQVLVSRYPMKFSRAQLAALSHFKQSGGTFGSYMSLLRTSGLMIEEDGFFFASERGISFIGGTQQEPQSSEETRKMWRDNLKEGAKKMFDIIVSVYPESVSKENIGEQSGFISTGGTFNSYLSIMRSNEIIEVKGNMVRASDNLFID